MSAMPASREMSRNCSMAQPQARFTMACEEAEQQMRFQMHSAIVKSQIDINGVKFITGRERGEIL